MGQYVPRLVSPLTGTEESRPGRDSYTFPPTPANLDRWRRWWRFANLEQTLTFFLVTVVTIVLTSMLAHSMLYGQPGLPNNVSFLRIQGERLSALVAPWFGTLFWVIGAFSLFGSAMGIIDYTSRLAADVIKSTYLSRSSVSESRLYFGLVWGLVVIGCLVLLSGLTQPLVLLIISATLGGGMMCLYAALLIVINRRHLPPAIRVRSFRLASLVWATVVFGALALVTLWQQVSSLLRPAS